MPETQRTTRLKVLRFFQKAQVTAGNFSWLYQLVTLSLLLKVAWGTGFIPSYVYYIFFPVGLVIFLALIGEYITFRSGLYKELQQLTGENNPYFDNFKKILERLDALDKRLDLIENQIKKSKGSESSAKN